MGCSAKSKMLLKCVAVVLFGFLTRKNVCGQENVECGTNKAKKNCLVVDWHNYTYYWGKDTFKVCGTDLPQAECTSLKLNHPTIPPEVRQNPSIKKARIHSTDSLTRCPLKTFWGTCSFAVWNYTTVYLRIDNESLGNLEEVCRKIDRDSKVATYESSKVGFPVTLSALERGWVPNVLAIARGSAVHCIGRNHSSCTGIAALVCQKEKEWFNCGRHQYVAAEEKHSQANGTAICAALQARRPALPTCEDVMCYDTFRKNMNKYDLEKAAINYSTVTLSAFKLPPKRYDEVSLVGWNRPTYCKNDTSLSKILASAASQSSGQIQDLEYNLRDISFNFPIKDLGGLVETVTINSKENLFPQRLENGVQTSRASVSHVRVSATLKGPRVALSFAQTRLPPASTRRWVGEHEQDEANRAVQMNFVADEDYLLLDVYDPRVELKIQASANFSIQPTGILGAKVLPALQKTANGGSYYVADATYVCVFLDQSSGSSMRFKPTGCRVVQTNGSYVNCACNHTSVFTAMLSVRMVVVPALLKYISYGVQGLTVLFLLITAGALFAVRQAVNNDRTFVQINLCLTLVFLHVTSVFHDLFVLNPLVCEIATVALHFFLLSSGFWMLLEGVTLAIKTSKLAIRYSKNNRPAMNVQRVLVGWFIPAAITAAAAGYGFASDSYMEVLPIYRFAGNGSTALKYNRCWVDQSSHIYWWGVMGPMAFAVLVNLVILVRVFVLVYNMERKQPVPRVRPGPPNPAGLLALVAQCVEKPTGLAKAFKSVLFLCPVLGVPWILPFFVGITPASSVVLLYANLAFNGLQGVLLFLVYCVRGEEVRKALGRQMEKSGISLSHSRGRGASQVTEEDTRRLRST